MTRRPALLLGWLLVLLLAGCSSGIPAPSPATGGTASPSSPPPDFTRPGAAQAMVGRLLAAAGSHRALLVTVTARSVQVSVLNSEDQPVTWAYRDGEVGEVHSDLAYVDQAVFDPADFNFADVGAMFRAAAGMSGSEQSQSLNIVDYSGGEVMMSVSTVPESRTVFFTPEGALLQPLNFDTPGGIRTGIAEVTGDHPLVYSITVQSDQAVSADFPGTGDTTVRRTRSAMVPVITNVRAETIELPLFNPARVDPDVIWQVLADLRGDEIPEATPWTMIVDGRDGPPRMYFSISGRVVVTDLTGSPISN